MQEDILKIIKDNAGSNLQDMSLINSIKVSKILASNFTKFYEWKLSSGEEWQYYTFTDLYNYWKNNIRE